jgi:hypothetical protein
VVRTEFDRLMADLGAFYEKKVQPTGRTFDLWFDKIKTVPSESLRWIEKKIQDECEFWPRNITSTIWAFYHAWLSTYPEKREAEKDVECPECNHGLIHVQKQNDRKQWVDYTFRCGKCQQSNLNGIPMMPKRALLNQGYSEIPVNAEDVQKRNIAAITKTVGKSIPALMTWEKFS